MSPKSTKTGMNRRGFLATSAATGAALTTAGRALGKIRSSKVDDVNVALIGIGVEGSVLLTENMLKMDGLRFKAVCDIWPYRRTYAQRLLARYKHDVQAFEDYKEMLATVKDVDAVVIATPDVWHSPMTVDCLKAGMNVYCEKEMSNTLEGAKKMVEAAKATGKLLQIGHQRRSNPLYRKAREMIREKQALGQITHILGQWNRHKSLKFTWKEKFEIPVETLKKYGYETMDEFRNWRWYKKFSGGPIADLGSHQVDIFNWVLEAPPKELVATGGKDYYKDHEWYDNANVLYEWEYDWQGKTCTARGFYQVLNTTSHGGTFETYMGDEGSLKIGEFYKQNGIRREHTVKAAEWETSKEMLDAMKRLMQDKAPKKEEEKKEETTEEKEDDTPKIAHSIGHEGRYFPIPMPEDWSMPPHRWHLENFFAAVRDPKKVKLNCPGEVGYETAMSVLPVNESMADEKFIHFKPEDFEV